MQNAASEILAEDDSLAENMQRVALLPYGLRRLAGDPVPMADEESAAHAALLTEYPALEDEHSGQDEYPEEIDARLGQLEITMDALEQRPLVYNPTKVAYAGVFLTLDQDGSLAIYRGYVRPEGEPREKAAVKDGGGADDMGQGDAGVSSWQASTSPAVWPFWRIASASGSTRSMRR